MAVGKITGQMLGDTSGNLDRDGVNLAFDNDLIYLDVVNRRVGIRTTSPTHDLHVSGTTRTTILESTTSAQIANVSISSSQIYSDTGVLNLAPPSGNQVVYQNKLQIDDIQIEGNRIATVNSNADLEFTANGTGTINFNSDVEVLGSLHATGVITADGNLQLGNSDTDSITFNADIASDVIPDTTDTYRLGTASKRWLDVWVQNLNADTVSSAAIEVSGIEIGLKQGNIYYVAVNGDDGNSGEHQNDPLSSVGRALDLATAGDTVYIYPGTYQETLPLVVPVGVTVKGAGLRSVTIQPDSDVTVDIFHLNGETTIEDLTITGYEYDSGSNVGYAFRFAPGFKVTTKSPYIRNVSVITAGSSVRLLTNPADDPRGFLDGDAGKGAYIDGSVVDATSKEASMLFHSVTFICPGVDTITCTNGVRVEWLNSFTYFANRSFYAVAGSTGFASDGKTRIKISTTVGTFAVGNTLSYYDTDGTTLLASGTIESIDGDFFIIDGKHLGFETPSDRAPKTIFTNGNAQADTSRFKFGTASLLLDGTGDYITVSSPSDFVFDADFAVEGFFYPTNVTGTFSSFTIGNEAANRFTTWIDNGQLKGNFYGSASVTFGGTITANTWTHIAFTRSGSTVRAFVNGTLLATTTTISGDIGNNGSFTVGADGSGSTTYVGSIDDVKVSKGVSRYTSSFTAPTTTLTGDNSTVLLLHFESTDGSTNLIDDGVTLQDIRSSAGGTATVIDVADYADFGAEIRAIASASVYGNYGVEGDGYGVIGYFISHNFGYVGSGRYSDNDDAFYPEDSTSVDEIIQINGAKIYFTSVNHKGDFRVGDYFWVDQSSGTVTFNPNALTIESSTGVTFTDGVNTTEITPTKVETGNIRISGNTIESVVNGITLTAANAQVDITSNVSITGTLDVDSNFTVSGNSTIGDSSSDTLTINSLIDSSITPSTNTTYNLGSSTKQWNNVYLAQAVIDDITISGNLIKTTVSNSNLELRANGTGIISIPSNNVEITNNLTVLGTTTLKNTNLTGLLTAENLTVNNPVVSSSFLTGDIEIQGNVIRTVNSNSNLELRANGTGYVQAENLSIQQSNISGLVAGQDIELTPSGTGIVKINSNQSLQIPAGTDAQRPGTPTSGMIRFNSTANVYEGYNGSYWIQLGGLSDVDRNTYVIPETTPGANDNTIKFYADNFLAASLNSSTFNIHKINVDQIQIDGNVISTTASNTDLELRPNGTGALVIDGFKFTSNTLTNTNSGAITEFKSTGTGYYYIVGTNAVVIPAGTNLERPGSPQVGMIRFNTDQGLVEVFDGLVWGSVAGAAVGVTASAATDIAVSSALIFG